MRRFYEGVVSPAVVDSAELEMNRVIRSMPNDRAPSTAQILEFSEAFCRCWHTTDGPYKALIARGSRPVDPLILDFLKAFKEEFWDKPEPVYGRTKIPLIYYRSLFSMEEAHDEQMVVPNEKVLGDLSIMCGMRVQDILKHILTTRPFHEVVGIAKILFVESRP